MPKAKKSNQAECNDDGTYDGAVYGGEINVMITTLPKNYDDGGTKYCC